MLTHLLEAAFLGLVQGVTEFLPVSSTGHLILFQKLFGLDQRTYGLSFDMFTNLGTTLALFWFFRSDLWELLRLLRLPGKGRPLSQAERVPWWILGVTVLVGAVGFLLEDQIATTFRTLPLIAAMLAGFGVLMLVAERYATQRTDQLSARTAYGMGLAQIIAFLPGVSRSGVTITTGLFLGLTRAAAARFSFLLSAPITLAAIVKRLSTAAGDFQATPPTAEVTSFYLVGFLVAGVAGYYSIKFLLGYLARFSLAAFAYYRLTLAAAIVIGLLVTG